MSERARELLGFEGSRQRYPDIESVRDLEDISDPTTIDDESATGIRKLIAKHKVAAVTFSLVGAVVVAVALAFAWQYLPLVVTNPFVIAIVVLVATFVFGARHGWRKNQRRVEEIDELNLKYADLLKPFKGVYIDGGRNSPPIFIPIKGFRKPGRRPTPYTAADVDPDLLERAEGHVDPDAPAAIRLHPEFVDSRSTETGTRVCQLTSGIDPDSGRGNGDEQLTVLKASAPNTADPDKVERINEQNEKLAKKKKDLQNDVQEKKNKIRDLRQKLYEPVDERVDKELDRVTSVVDAMQGRGGSTSRGDGQKVTTGSPDSELEQTADEVEAD